MLNYIATSNHVHLLVRDSGENAISRSLQLVAGRTAQEFNRRKSRNGAFWEDRYFATAVATGCHLLQCLVYIDLNMVRAGAVQHPSGWKVSGYHDIQTPPSRYRIIDYAALCELTGMRSLADLRSQHREWIACELTKRQLAREPKWTENAAVGSEDFLRAFESTREAGGVA